MNALKIILVLIIAALAAFVYQTIAQEKYAPVVTDAILRVVEAARTGMPLNREMAIEA